MLGNQLNKANHHFLLCRDSAVTHILVTTIYTPLDLWHLFISERCWTSTSPSSFLLQNGTAIVGEAQDVFDATQTHLIYYRLQLVFHLCLYVDHKSPWLFSSSLELTTDSFQSIPSNCMQNRHHEIFNRGIYVCAGRHDIRLARNQLGTPGEAENFLRGVLIF